MWTDFHFLRPLWLLLPVVAWLLLRLIPRSGRPAGLWHAHVDPALAPWVLQRVDGPVRGRWSVLALLTALGIVCAGPSWEQLPRPQIASGHALVVALDLSRSMLAEDLKPSRLTRARFKLEALFDGRSGGQTALLVYAADAFLVAPLTSDLETLRLQLPVLEPDLMPAQGSRADRAYARAVQMLREGGFPDGEVLLVTDGIDAVQQAALAALCARHGNRLSILAAATVSGAPVPGLRPGAEVVMSRLDPGRIARTTQACGGQAVTLTPDDSDVRALAAAFQARAEWAKAEDAGLTALEWLDRGPWLLLALLPWLAYRMRLQASHALLLGIALAGLPAPAPAMDTDWLWQHADERGRAHLEAGDAAAAAARFADPRWKAYAAAQAGDLEQAVALLAPLDDAGSLYNRGTALARLGRFQEALAALEGALARDPAHADARHNHRLIQELLAARQQQPDEPGAGESGPDAETPPPGERGDAGDRSPPAEEAPGTETEPPEPGAPEPGDEAEASGAGKPPDTAAQALQRPADAPEATEADPELRESAQATEQWLSRIPDDPGGLLRNKFRQQYRRGRDSGAAEPSDEEPW